MPAWPKLERKVHKALADPGARVRRVKSRGKVFWLKQRERPSLRFRLLKGDPARNFAQELRALRWLAEQGLPVPDIVAEGPGFVLLEDAGMPVRHVLAEQRDNPGAQAATMAAAGRALAVLHGAGVAHGRPALRDMCLRDGVVRFIDLENTRVVSAAVWANPARLRRDLIAFAHDTFKELRTDGPAARAGFDAYRAADRQGVWEDTAAWLRRNRWPLILTRPLQNRHNGRGRDFRAIPMVYGLFTGHG